MKSRFSILKRLAAYVVIGCVFSVAITVTTSALYLVFLLTGLTKDPMHHIDHSRSFSLQSQSGDVIDVDFYDDFIVSVAIFFDSSGKPETVRRSSSFPFSNSVLSRAYTQALFVASKSRLGPRGVPSGLLFGFGLPCTSAYFQISACAPGNFGYLSGGINLLSSNPLLASPFNVIIPYTLLWQGLLINALFWAGTCFALHRGIVPLFKRLRRSNVRSPQHAQRDGTMPRV